MSWSELADGEHYVYRSTFFKKETGYLHNRVEVHGTPGRQDYVKFTFVDHGVTKFVDVS